MDKINTILLITFILFVTFNINYIFNIITIQKDLSDCIGTIIVFSLAVMIVIKLIFYFIK